MTPISRFLCRLMPPGRAIWALTAIYTMMLISVFLVFQISATNIPYADQRDTEAWRMQP